MSADRDTKHAAIGLLNPQPHLQPILGSFLPSSFLQCSSCERINTRSRVEAVISFYIDWEDNISIQDLRCGDCMKERRKGYSWLIFALDVYTCAHITDETVRIRSLFLHTWSGILFPYYYYFYYLFYCTCRWWASLTPLAVTCVCHWPESYGSADFGSHGCPWECGLQLLHLRGAETVPKGQGGGGVEWYFRVCTDHGPATCDWMGVARMLRRSNKQRYLLQPWQIIKAIRLSRDGFSSKVYAELLFCLLHCRAQFKIACFSVKCFSRVSHCGCYRSVLKWAWFVWGVLLVC